MQYSRGIADLVDEYGIRAEFDKLRQDSETLFDEE